MARPTKYTQELANEVVKLVRQGYNLRAAARVVGASEASLSRWRDKHSDFNKAINSATKEQSETACRLAGIRPYKRKAYISPYYDTEPYKPQTQPKEEKVRRRPQMWLGLPIKPQPLENEPTDPYLNPNTKCVEWIDKSGVFHTCHMWLWEDKHRPQPQHESILDCFF